MKLVGNILIVASISALVFLFYPLAKIYLFPPQIEEVKAKSGFHITIPSINAQSQVIPNVDPFNQKAYSESLRKGVAHASTSNLPGEKGTVFIFAHSSGAPWEVTRYNTIFFRLGDLTTGDEVLINYDNKVLSYEVFDKKIVNPSETEYLKGEEDVLILQTCYPIGTDLKRLLIFAKPRG